MSKPLLRVRALTRGRSPRAPLLRADRDRRYTALVITLCLVWLLLISLVQVGSHDQRLAVVPWLMLAPLIASLLVSCRATALVSLAFVLSVGSLGRASGDLGDGTGAVRVTGAVSVATFAAVAARVRVRREQHIRTVTRIATVAQTAIQNPVPDRVGDLAMASRYVSANAHSLVGGDLFDVVSTEEGVRLIVGDVRGKGLAAVHTAAAVLSAFRHHAALPGTDLSEVAVRVERAVAGRLGPEDFVTAALCTFHPDGRLDVVLCGHPSPLLLSAGADPEPTGRHPGPPLGLGVTARVESAVLHPGQRLLLFTDGLVEARDRRGRFFDLDAAARLVSGDPAARCEEQDLPAALDADLEELLVAVRRHVGGVLDDDLAVILVQRLPTALARTA